MFESILLIDLLVVFTIVIADRNADLDCVMSGNRALNGKTDQELMSLGQQNLNTGKEMVRKRIEVSKQQNLNCYYDFYNTYIENLEKILQTGLNDTLSRARNKGERSGAIKAIASISQTMICDENWRALHVNDLIKCTQIEANGAIKTKFNLRLRALMGSLSFGGSLEKLKNSVMSSIISEIKQLFSNIYNEGKQCSDRQPKEHRCINWKKFVLELDRLFYLGGLAVQSKLIPILNKN